ncbi:alpha/beta hydrolase [Sphingosinicella sp. BN140058]|uniref:alpha/beta hydrolase n=1 Tax=Sphingosinicella sp. BN140058 TaxID=1892855 RepID=UPI0013EBAA7B|nr:alpha/beta hydrolase [Sphingosinicella sp. BN140058]
MAAAAFTMLPTLASAQTPNEIFAKARKLRTADAVDDTGLVPIGGIDQWISVRGRHRDNPILLFVHGGPGFTASPVSYHYMRDWEEYFTVAHWDQRGAGKTYAANDPAKVRPTMSVARMVDDAEGVAAYLRRKYGKRRIVLMAHSFGTIIGLKLAQRHPDWFHAYVGTGQFVDFQRSEAEGYAATLQAARAANNAQAVADLIRMAPFPDPAHPERNVQNLGIERKWLAAFGGYYWPAGEGHNVAISRFSPDYSEADLKTRDAAQAFSDQALWGEIGTLDLSRSTAFRLPVVILQGRHDLGTSSALVAKWFGRVTAPSKQLVWFEDSAHMTFEEEPGKMLVSLVDIVRPLARE